MNKTISENLIKKIESSNLSQREFAEKVGVTEATISRYLSGNRTPRIEILIKISKVLEISMDNLLGISNIQEVNIKKDIEPIKIKCPHCGQEYDG